MKYACFTGNSSWAFHLRRTLGLISAALAMCFLSGCAGAPSTLDSAGPKGQDITTLWWVMFVIAAIVCAVTMTLVLYATFRHQREGEVDRGESTSAVTFVAIGGALIPAIILVVLFGFVLQTMNAMSAPGPKIHYNVRIIGHRWWWEFRYLNQKVDTGNELHVPVGQPVHLGITSADVIHSVWVPQVQQKMDAIPGRINSMWFEAKKPGVYTGECAEFCGQQHANMDFVVIAQAPTKFQQWLKHEAQPAPQPKTALVERGQQVFLGSACVYCHTVDGTNASGTIGPDLTHLASRRTLAAGIIRNTPGNLAGWIANSQSIKPGNAMPPMYLDSKDMQALLAYLETLK